MRLNYNRPPAPVAMIYEFDYGVEAWDESDNLIPGSNVTYSVCGPIWYQLDEDDEGRWEPNLDHVIEEFFDLKDAQAFLAKLEREANK
ncbi:MAG: hypothetical protein VXX11_03545 [Planctomycetota bacterium]|nr:hypothetical protein [Planctomycetota bacterium]